MTGHAGNGRLPEPQDDDLDEGGPDDDSPLDADEAAAAAEVAQAETDESLDERVEAVIEDLDAVTRQRDGEAVSFLVGGRAFAVLTQDQLEVALEPGVARAALATPDTQASKRGRGWIGFRPAVEDRFALDRAEAWIRLAHRRAAG
jgi:hypothetical protein